MNTTLLVVLVIFFFILILIAVIISVVWASNATPGSPGIGQSCTGTCVGDLICSPIDEVSSSTSGICLLPVGSACAVSSQCTNLALCLGSVCKYSNGAPCSNNAECASGICSSGLCSSSAIESAKLPSDLQFSRGSLNDFSNNIRWGDSSVCLLDNDKEAHPDRKTVNPLNPNSAIDATMLGEYVLVLIQSGDIIVDADERTGLQPIHLDSMGTKFSRIFTFKNTLYGISSGRLYRLLTNIEDVCTGSKGKWVPVPVQQEVNHASCSLDGSVCWIQNSKSGRLVRDPIEFSHPLPPLDEPGVRILGRTANISLVIKPDGSMQYRGRRWRGVTSAVLLNDDTPLVEHNPGVRLVVLGKEAVLLE
jgi:hypothetical protein